MGGNRGVKRASWGVKKGSKTGQFGGPKEGGLSRNLLGFSSVIQQDQDTRKEGQFGGVEGLKKGSRPGGLRGQLYRDM